MMVIKHRWIFIINSIKKIGYKTPTQNEDALLDTVDSTNIQSPLPLSIDENHH